MERVVHKAQGFKEAEEWDIQQQVSTIAPAGTTLIDKTPVTVTVHIVTEQPELPGTVQKPLPSPAHQQ